MSGPHTDSEITMSADDLISQWCRVGIQIDEVAVTMFEKSKASVIGDGSYDGFVAAVIVQDIFL